MANPNKPPQIRNLSQCNGQMDFKPRTPWPDGLPAVAVNGVVLAGFGQDLVFDHSIPWAQQEEIAQLFRSLYFELTFTEISRMIEKAADVPELPLFLILQKFGYQSSGSLFATAKALRALPEGFQEWCADRKLSPQDLAPILSARSLDLKPLLAQILTLSCSRNIGAHCLEMGVELLLMGKTYEDLQVTAYSSEEIHDSPESWHQHLKRLRYPETSAKDAEQASRLKKLPWPGQSQVRWTRNGDKGGFEIKLFVSQPSDLKKHLTSLAKVHDILEQEQESYKKPQ